MEYRKLDEKAIKSFRRGKGILLAVMTLIAALIIAFGSLAEMSDVSSYAIIGIGIIIEALFLAVFIIYPPLEYAQWKYLLTDDRVEIEHGIFFKKRSIIPIIRIQNISVSQGPINRSLGLYELQIYIASGNFEIPCLSKEDADAIADNLKDKIYTRLREREERDE